MKKLLFLGACLVALASTPVKAQTSGSEVVVVRVTRLLKGYASIVTTYGPGTTQVKEIDLPINEAKSSAVLAEACQQALIPLVQQGYILKGMSGGDSVTTLIFTKGQ